MKALIKFELYKIFSRKIVLILVLVCATVSIMPIITEYMNIKEKGLSYNSIKNAGKEYEGQVITNENQDTLEEKGNNARVRYNNGETITDKEKVIAFGMLDYWINLNPKYTINGKDYKVKDIKKEVVKMEKEGKVNTYEYKNIKYIQSLIDKKETPKYYFKFGWEQATEFFIKPILIAILITVSISTIFSNDYQSNTIPIVLSSKNGKGKLTWAKLTAGLIFSTIVFLIINGVQVVNLAIHGFDGWDVPLSFFVYYVKTPYNIDMATYYIFGLLLSFIGVMLFTLLIMLVSLISKNNMISFALSIAMLLGPEFISKIMPIYTLSRIFKDINIQNLMEPITIFGDINTYNIFSSPILYLNIMIVISLISIPIVWYFINKLGKKQVV